MDGTDYSKYLIPRYKRHSVNYDSNNTENSYDFVSLMTEDEFLSLPKTLRAIIPTDYTKLLGFKSFVDQSYNKIILNGGLCGSTNGVNSISDCQGIAQSIRPVISLGLTNKYTENGLLNLTSQQNDEFNSIIRSIKRRIIDGKIWAFLEVGTFPQTYVGESLNSELEWQFLFGGNSSKLKPISRLYVGEEGLGVSPFYHQEFEFCGERYVRVCNRNMSAMTMSNGEKIIGSRTSGSVFWVKIEPVRYYILNWDNLPSSINPKGNGKDNFINLVTQNSIMTSIPNYFQESEERVNDWQDYRVINYLNGRFSLNGEKVVRDYSLSGGFLCESLNLSRKTPNYYRLPSDVQGLRKNSFFGCNTLDKIRLNDSKKVYRSIYMLSDLGLKFFYQVGKNQYEFSSKMPKLENQLVYNTDDVKKYFPDYDYYSVDELFSKKWHYNMLNKLKKNNYPINYNFFSSMPSEEDVEKFAEESNFVFAGELLRQLGKVFSKGAVETIFKNKALRFMMGIGCFSNKKVVDKQGRETDTFLAQKACSFFYKLCLNDFYFDEIISLWVDYTFNPSQEFLAFIMVKNSEGNYENLDLLIKLNEKYNDIFTSVMGNFSDVKKFRKGINKKGVPFTKSWENTIVDYYVSSSYNNTNETNKDIADFFLQRGVLEDIFEVASDLRDIALREKTRHHILNKALKEETILESVEKIKAQTGLLLTQSNLLIDEAYDKQFTFEFLDKYDPKNFIIGMLVDCCCTICGGLYGSDIARHTVINDRVQNIVLRDSFGDIVGKGTIYVNENGEAVINEFDLKESFRTNEGRRFALKAFIRAVKSFVEEYDIENPNAPLKKVNVGMGFNKLTRELLDFDDESTETFVKTPKDIRFDDAQFEQKKIYDRRFNSIQSLDELEKNI